MPIPRFPEERRLVKCPTCRDGLLHQDHRRYSSDGNCLGVRPCCSEAGNPDALAHEPYCPDRCPDCFGFGMTVARRIDRDDADSVLRTVCGEAA